jgi:chromosome partitioning protein
MKTLLIANPKGGAGKTTLATNLAGALAAAGETVYLWDLDRQKSALTWLALRPPTLPPIPRLDQAKGKRDGWLILDSPAGLHGARLNEIVEQAHRIIVPIVPSLFDLAATRDFLADLAALRTVRKGKADIAIIGMRVDARTKAAEKLDAFLEPIELPVLTHIRETQNYVNAAFEGRSVFDLPPYLNERDVEQWQPLLDWLTSSPA